jgi:hypothetical protein
MLDHPMYRRTILFSKIMMLLPVAKEFRREKEEENFLKQSE